MYVDDRLILDLLTLVEKWDRSGRHLQADKDRYKYNPDRLCLGDADHSPKTFQETAQALSRVLAQYYVRQNIQHCPRVLSGAIRREQMACIFNEMSIF